MSAHAVRVQRHQSKRRRPRSAMVGLSCSVGILGRMNLLVLDFLLYNIFEEVNSRVDY